MISRREFLRRIGAATVAAASVAVAAVPLISVLESCNPTSLPAIPDTTPPTGSDGRIGVDVSDLSDTVPAKYASGLAGSDGKPVLVTRVSSTEFHAFSSKCPHQGCIVDYRASGGLLPCPCHASHFALDGSRHDGLAPTGLLVYDAVYDSGANQLRVLLT